ncbi:MAG: hypothetical protein IBJ10_05975 [Phycisphaerales bacterium]|nr:hypothetical protein [Phycisphaerales bacterium]
MKHAKHVVIAIAPIALVAGLILFFRGGSDLPSGARFVDVRTGAMTTLTLSEGRARVIPAFAEDGERTLFPVTRAEGGGWMIEPHYQPVFTAKFADATGLKIDPTTFRVID